MGSVHLAKWYLYREINTSTGTTHFIALHFTTLHRCVFWQIEGKTIHQKKKIVIHFIAVIWNWSCNILFCFSSLTIVLFIFVQFLFVCFFLFPSTTLFSSTAQYANLLFFIVCSYLLNKHDTFSLDKTPVFQGG